ncbi:MAG TPA: hypothetical protein VIG50_10630 [Vicinamibacteria bacterium]
MAPARPTLPDDARLVELRAEHVTFRSKRRVAPGTVIEFDLVMEGRPWSLSAPVVTCLARKDGGVAMFEMRVSFESLSEPDRKLISLFIEKGRGAPQLAPARTR